MNRTMLQTKKNFQKKWLRKKDIDSLFGNHRPQPLQTGTMRGLNAINVFTKQLNAQGPHGSILADALLGTLINGTPQMVDTIVKSIEDIMIYI